MLCSLKHVICNSINSIRLMNNFGTLLKTTIYGESHGSCVGIVIDGCPAGIELLVEDFRIDIERRKGGIQKGTTPRQETDLPIFKTGIFNNKTTGAPICIEFENANTRSGDYEKQRAIPRPGHADFVAHHKYFGNEDFRGGGHFSGRLTVCLVAAGVVSKKVIAHLQQYFHLKENITIQSKLLEIGGETNLEKGLQKAIDAKDSIGGLVDCTVTNLPLGLGEPFFNSIESVLSQAIFSIPAIKGIEFGKGFEAAKMFGAEHNDVILDKTGTTKTNNAGGIVGGITNGNDLYFKVVVKPTSSTPKEQETYNWETNSLDVLSVKGRHDLCIALRVPVVVEAVTAMVMADFMLIRKTQLI